LGRLGVLDQGAGARVVDILLARVSGQQRLVAARRLASGRLLLALARVGGLFGQALLLGALGVDALDYQALAVQQLDRPALALGWNPGTVIALAVLADAAVGLGLGSERKRGERDGDGDESWAHDCCCPLAANCKGPARSALLKFHTFQRFAHALRR